MLTESRITIRRLEGHPPFAHPITVRTGNPRLLLKLLTALYRWARGKFAMVSRKEHFDRSSHCALCPSWSARSARCLQCGCTGLKLRLKTEHCPLGKW